MRTVNTHLSSYLFVFYISWFDTTLTLTLTSKYHYPFIRAVAQWARASEWETERLWYAPHLVAQHTAVAPFARHIHTNVYMNTVDRNEREFTSDCHAWACCCVAKINEWKLRYTTVCDCIFAHQKNTINSTNTSCEKNERLCYCHHYHHQQTAARFHPYFLSNMHMWIVHGAIYELVCSVLFDHFPDSIIRSIVRSFARAVPLAFTYLLVLASLYYEYLESLISNVQ